MRVKCPICWGDHPKWECKASANKSTVARKDVPKAEEPKLQHIEKVSGGGEVRRTRSQVDTQSLPVDTSPKRGPGRPKTITDMKAYKAEWARRNRAKKKAAKDAAIPKPINPNTPERNDNGQD